jgi:hypothetical protein
MMYKMRVSTNSGNKGFAAPVDKPAKTPLSTLKQHEKFHGVPGEPEIDVDVCEFEHRCIQDIQPPTLLFIQFAMSVCSAKFKQSLQTSRRLLVDLIK